MGKNLIIFMKNPQLGFVKTRLARTVGDKRVGYLLAISREM